jgi:hypothetical protein
MALNPTVRWIVPTDAWLQAPPNVAVQKISFPDFAARCQKHFDFPLALQAPYKVTDLRPAFGEIFAEEIGTASFWGHCDWDVIFGDIRHSITDVVLDTYDKILVRGSFALYRNTQTMNTIFRAAKGGVDYRKVFSSERLDLHFDEWGGIWKILQAEGISVWNEDVLFDISPVRPKLRAYASSATDPLYRWQSGRIIEVDRSNGHEVEGLAIHLQKRSMKHPVAGVLGAPTYWFSADDFHLDCPRREPIASVANFYMGRVRRKVRPLISQAPPAT